MGGFGTLTTPVSEVWLEPGGRRIAAPLFEGEMVFVSNTTAAAGEAWYRIEFQLRAKGVLEYTFAWLPATIHGEPSLAPVADMRGGCPDHVPLVADLAPMHPMSALLCAYDSDLTLAGYLLHAPSEDGPYSGDPDWLASDASTLLLGAFGPAVEGGALAVRLDPTAAVTFPEEIYSAGDQGTLVHLTGHFLDPASERCQRTPNADDVPVMTGSEQQQWCKQQFVVTQIHVGEWAARDLSDLDVCERDRRYRVAFPDAWYTNTPYPGIPSCVAFNPGQFGVVDDMPPSGVAIEIQDFSGAIAFLNENNESTDVTVGGRPARRIEVSSAGCCGGMMAAWEQTYEYLIQLDDSPETGMKLLASTSNTGPGDYETNRAVLDLMMESLELLDSP